MFDRASSERFVAPSGSWNIFFVSGSGLTIPVTLRRRDASDWLCAGQAQTKLEPLRTEFSMYDFLYGLLLKFFRKEAMDYS